MAAADPAELGRRLREGDRSAAPAALNLIEDRSAAANRPGSSQLAPGQPRVRCHIGRELGEVGGVQLLGPVA